MAILSGTAPPFITIQAPLPPSSLFSLNANLAPIDKACGFCTDVPSGYIVGTRLASVWEEFSLKQDDCARSLARVRLTRRLSGSRFGREKARLLCDVVHPLRGRHETQAPLFYPNKDRFEVAPSCRVLGKIPTLAVVMRCGGISYGQLVARSECCLILDELLIYCSLASSPLPGFYFFFYSVLQLTLNSSADGASSWSGPSCVRSVPRIPEGRPKSPGSDPFGNNSGRHGWSKRSLDDTDRSRGGNGGANSPYSNNVNHPRSFARRNSFNRSQTLGDVSSLNRKYCGR